MNIYNDDCFKIFKEIKDSSIDCIITDPPYGVLSKGKKMRNNKNDNFEWDNIDLEKFTKEWFEEVYKKLKDNSFMFVFWSQKYFNLGIKIFNPNRIIFWRYNNLINNPSGDFAYDYEPIFVIKKGNPKLTKGKNSCDLEFTKPQSNFKKDKLVHPTQKPLELLKHLVSISTKEGDIILDCFAGSGTTGVACKELNREFILIEKDKEYFKLIEERLK
jgi:DNA modification methylase